MSDESSQRNRIWNVTTIEVIREKAVSVVRDIAFVKRFALLHTIRGPIPNMRFKGKDNAFSADSLPVKSNHDLGLLRVSMNALFPLKDLRRKLLADQERPCWSLVVNSLRAERVEI